MVKHSPLLHPQVGARRSGGDARPATAAAVAGVDQSGAALAVAAGQVEWPPRDVAAARTAAVALAVLAGLARFAAALAAASSVLAGTPRHRCRCCKQNRPGSRHLLRGSRSRSSLAAGLTLGTRLGAAAMGLIRVADGAGAVAACLPGRAGAGAGRQGRSTPVAADALPVHAHRRRRTLPPAAAAMGRVGERRRDHHKDASAADADPLRPAPSSGRRRSPDSTSRRRGLTAPVRSETQTFFPPRVRQTGPSLDSNGYRSARTCTRRNRNRARQRLARPHNSQRERRPLSPPTQAESAATAHTTARVPETPPTLSRRPSMPTALKRARGRSPPLPRGRRCGCRSRRTPRPPPSSL